MTFLELLKPQAVKVLSAASSKKRLMHDIAELAETAYGLHAPAVVEALMERESLGPTGVGHGVALPHAPSSCWNGPWNSNRWTVSRWMWCFRCSPPKMRGSNI